MRDKVATHAALWCGLLVLSVACETAVQGGPACGEGTTVENGVCIHNDASGPACGPGTVEKNGVCALDDGSADGQCGKGTSWQGERCVADGSAPARVCGVGTTEVDGFCVPDGPLVTEFKLEGVTLKGPSETTLHLNYPVEVVLQVRATSDAPVVVPVLIGLRDAGSDADCVLGAVEVVHPGVGVVTASGRFFVPATCLGATNAAAAVPVAGLFRKMRLTTTIDASNVVRQAEDPQPPPTTEHADVVRTVTEAPGVDFDLRDIAMHSSVIVRDTCLTPPPGSKGRCWNNGLVEDRHDGGIELQTTVEAYGHPGVDAGWNAENVLGGAKMTLAYAIRAVGEQTWQPLWLQRQGEEKLHQSALVEDNLRASVPHLYAQPLNFDNGCDGDDCTKAGPVAKLLDHGAWKHITEFEVRACLSTDAETSGQTANNCRSRKILILRSHKLPPDPNAALEAFNGPGAKNGVSCPAYSTFCYDFKKELTKGLAVGKKGYFELSGGIHTFSRADMMQFVTKHDFAAEIKGLANFELFKLYAYAAAYTDPDVYEKDPDVPAGCSCPVMNKSTFLSADGKCKGACDNPKECQGKKGKQLARCKKACAATCSNSCLADNKKCGPKCDSEYPKCLDNWGKTGVKASQASKKTCAAKRDTCKKNCKGKVLGCSKTSMGDSKDCQCQAYYKLGVDLFGKTYWSKQKAGPLKFVYKISYSKEKKKEKTFNIGPVPISVSVQAVGEMGIVFSISLSATSGDQEPTPLLNRCAQTTTTDRCGGESTDGTCYCDFACQSLGDCCVDYDRVCQFNEPTLPVVKTHGLCQTETCHKALARATYVASLVGEIKPYATLDVEAAAGLDAAVMRAAIYGKLNLLDATLPLTLAGRMGVEGPAVSPHAIRFVPEIFMFLNVASLAGEVGVTLDHRDIKWCTGWPIDYPCGLSWTTFWRFAFGKWKGIKEKYEIFKIDFGATLDIDFISDDAPSCTNPACSSKQ